jgi:hypothetical protein
MNQFRLLYIWKCHSETPYITILSKQKCHFFLQTQRKGGWNRSCLLVPVGGARGERV